jgi:hypothetical protein
MMNRSDKLESLSHRLDEMRMSDHDRIRAKAHLERAEAIADLLAALARGVRHLFRKAILRPLRRAYASAG